MIPRTHPLISFIPEASTHPRKPAHQRRTIRVTLPVSEEERLQIRAVAAERGCSIATLLRSALGRIPMPRVEVETLKELRRIAVNVNQLARAVNADLAWGSPVQESVDEVKDLLRNVLLELRRPYLEDRK